MVARRANVFLLVEFGTMEMQPVNVTANSFVFGPKANGYHLVNWKALQALSVKERSNRKKCVQVSE